MKNTQFAFTLTRYDGNTVVHVAETLGEFLAFRENVEKSIASATPTSWRGYTVTFPKASAVYRNPKALVNRVVNRTIMRIHNGGTENKA